MAFKLKYQPVIQPLPLADYHQSFAPESIPVCVNPPAPFMAERDRWVEEYSKWHLDIYGSTGSGSKFQGDDLVEKMKEFDSWRENVFLPALNDWFARLFSYGDEKYTAEDLAEYGQVDAHFLAWLKQRAMEMIQEHRTGVKKN